MRLVRRLAATEQNAAASWLAAAAFWLYPLAPEASVWIAARFDQLALIGVLVACERHVAAQRLLDGPRLLSLLALAFALSSKEAAFLGPPLMFIAALIVSPSALPGEWPLRALWRNVSIGLRDLIPALVVLVTYLLVRWLLFGRLVQVYSVHSPVLDLGPIDVLRRVAAMWPVLEGPFGNQAGTLLALTGGALAAGAWCSWRDGRWLRAWLLPAAACVLSIAALAVHFSGSESGGFGARMFYATGAWLAIWLFLPFTVALRRHAAMAMAFVMLPVFALALTATTAPWREAGLTMRGLLPKITDVSALAHARGEFAVVLLPDLWQTTAFARNAQGGIGAGGIVPTNPFADDVLVAIPLTIDVLAHIKQQRIVIGEGKSLRLYCFDAYPWRGDVRLIETPISVGPGDIDAWWATWPTAVGASMCADDFPRLR